MSRSPKHKPKTIVPKTTRKITPKDEQILELLESAARKRELDIMEAANAPRRVDDALEIEASYEGIVAQEAVSLIRTMLKINRRIRLGRTAVKIERDEINHSDQSRFGNNEYHISTPIILATDPEFIDGAMVRDGYVFTTRHPRRGRGYNNFLTIDNVLEDEETGEIIRPQRSLFGIQLYDAAGDHPTSRISGSELGNDIDPFDMDDPRLLTAIGLIRLANDELSGK